MTSSCSPSPTPAAAPWSIAAATVASVSSRPAADACRTRVRDIHEMTSTGAESPIRVLLADPHALFRRGVRLVLDDERDIEVVGECADGLEAVDLIVELA